MSDDDIETLISLADENGDGEIQWDEFIPVGLEAIRTILARNKVMSKSKKFEKKVDKEALATVYWDEIKKAN